MVVGRKEAADGSVSIRRLGSQDQRMAGMAEALEELANEARAPDKRG
jgi:threonyl-tRNA synthetase